MSEQRGGIGVHIPPAPNQEKGARDNGRPFFREIVGPTHAGKPSFSLPPVKHKVELITHKD
jgi:hypothetical protein